MWHTALSSRVVNETKKKNRHEHIGTQKRAAQFNRQRRGQRQRWVCQGQKTATIQEKKRIREGMDPIPVNQKSDTAYQPFHGDAFHNPTGEPQGHLEGASGTGWSTQWYSCVWTGCLDKSSLTGDARPLFTGPKEQQEARLSKQASLTSAPWWLNSLAGQCGMSERLGARRVLESSQGVDWWRGITWGSRGRKDTIGGTLHGYTFFVHGKRVLARVGNWSMNLD